MGLRGPKPMGKVKITWSPNFAYAIGLLATDGNLSPDGRHINFTSKDLELVEKFIKSLNITCHIGKKARGGDTEKKYFVTQFGDVLFYKFLLKTGLAPAKSKTLGALDIPKKYFFDFLRGSFDGDGSFYSYFDQRWRSSFMYYLVFVSASRVHIDWLRKEIHKALGVEGHITKAKKSSIHQLKYAKKESFKILKKMYKNRKSIFLNRKLVKIKKALQITGEML